MQPKIILVEDDESVARLLMRQLARNGYPDVRQASTIAAARALIREHSWDLAILDRGLPDGDGIELCRELRSCSQHGYIVMVTGNASAEAKLEGFQHGADDYVTKPFHIDELLARIRAGARIVELQRQLEQLSLTDSLTNIGNRRAFDRKLVDAFEQARRYDRPLSLVLVDVDHFKRINDRYGHDAGDAVLRSVANLLRDHSRQADFVARIGGEEFAIVVPETLLFEAMQFGEKLRCEIAIAEIAPEPLSISLGIACKVHSRVVAAEELFRAADQALYRAKKNGRNRVEIERRRDLRRRTEPPRTEQHRAGG